MIALTNAGTADKIEFVTVGATVQLDWSCTQVDKAVADTNPTSAKTVVSNGQIASATTTKITTDPASSHEAMIREISGVNTHASASFSVQLQQTINGGTARKVSNAHTLAPGERLLINGDGTLFIYDATGGVKTSLAAALTISVLTSGSAATYTTPAGCRAIRVRAIGGGGAGGGGGTAASSAGLGAGGGSGSYCEKIFSPPSATYTYTIGAGGTAGTAGANAGNNGADTTFGSLTAKGGSGGGGMAGATTAASTSLGGAGGVVGSGGDLNMPGQPGNPGIRTSGTVGKSGEGAPSELGGGGIGVAAQGTGTTATANTGAGGSGGCTLNGGSATAGGAGGSGIVIVEEFY
jgi:hypothetical protein